MQPSEKSTSLGQTKAVQVIGAIPARYGSTRLQGKALLTIHGFTMIEHVYRRASEAKGLARIVVLTDDERIVSVVQGFGGNVEMTPTDCQSGTDRIAFAARHWGKYAVVNIQGDEPLIDPGIISEIAEHLVRYPEDPVVTVAADANQEELESPDVVKVVRDLQGFALYFSRAPIPFQRSEVPFGSTPALKHVGVYGYQYDSLLKIADLEPTTLEKTESLEQLRALENGIPIRVLHTAREVWWGVDTQADFKRTVVFLEKKHSRSPVQIDSKT